MLYEQIQEAREFIGNKANFQPKYGIILGTGLGNLSDEIKVEAEIPYKEIPHFPVSTVQSHRGKLLLGTLQGHSVVARRSLPATTTPWLHPGRTHPKNQAASIEFNGCYVKLDDAEQATEYSSDAHGVRSSWMCGLVFTTRNAWVPCHFQFSVIAPPALPSTDSSPLMASRSRLEAVRGEESTPRDPQKGEESLFSLGFLVTPGPQSGTSNRQRAVDAIPRVSCSSAASPLLYRSAQDRHLIADGPQTVAHHPAVTG